MENLDETFLKNANRSVARKVADNLSAIEEAISLGISQAEIIEYLSKKGITVTYFNFRTILQRLRKKKLKSAFPKQMKAIDTHRQDGSAIPNKNLPVASSAAKTVDVKMVTKHEPIISKPSSSRNQKSWREMKNEPVEW